MYAYTFSSWTLPETFCLSHRPHAHSNVPIHAHAQLHTHMHIQSYTHTYTHMHAVTHTLCMPISFPCTLIFLFRFFLSLGISHLLPSYPHHSSFLPFGRCLSVKTVSYHSMRGLCWFPSWSLISVDRGPHVAFQPPQINRAP